jgi:cytochrome c biogenesis protein CcmG/thiol:disulfide interchange protein DsbE
LLAREVVREFGGRARFESVDWGGSDLPRRYGITRYPVIFVDDVLVAKPDDFGWFGASGRYAPWREPSNHAKFQKDLSRSIALRLRGEQIDGGTPAIEADALQLATLPALTLTSLAGGTIDTKSLAGRVVLVEFWATWCPPCQSTLNWLGQLEQKYGSRLGVVAPAMDSEEPAVRAMAGSASLLGSATMGTPELAAAFGDISAVPTLFVFGPDGKTAGVFYGAPPDLHEKVEKLLEKLLAR